MQRPVFLLLALLASSLAQAQIYQWKDASGRTVFSDQPPPGNSVKTIQAVPEVPTARAPVVTGTQKSWAEKDLEFRKRLTERSEQEEKSRKEAAQAEALKKDCTRARQQLQALESGLRMAVPGEQGERVFIDDAQRQEEIDRSKKAISARCK